MIVYVRFPVLRGISLKPSKCRSFKSKSYCFEFWDLGLSSLSDPSKMQFIQEVEAVRTLRQYCWKELYTRRGSRNFVIQRSQGLPCKTRTSTH